MNNFLILLAAGKSSRFKDKQKKQFVKIKNKPLFTFSLDKFIKSGVINKYIIVLPKAEIKIIEKYLRENYKKLFESNKINLVIGGFERFDSVYSALCFIENNFLINNELNVIIHDSARPFVDVKDIKKMSKLIKKYKSISLACSLVDTLKIINKKSDVMIVKETINRDKICSIKTPQGFSFKLLLSAYKNFILNKKNIKITDDLQIIENFSNKKSYLLNSNPYNIKITNKEDLKLFKLFY